MNLVMKTRKKSLKKQILMKIHKILNRYSVIQTSIKKNQIKKQAKLKSKNKTVIYNQNKKKAIMKKIKKLMMNLKNEELCL